MTFADLPLWLQAGLVAEALAVLWLTARFGARGLVWSGLAAVGFWFGFALLASWLVGRLEGGRAADLSGVLSGAGLATLRLAPVGGPLVALAAVAGLGLRRLSRRKPKVR
jgi:hypothetical protein